MQAHNKNYKAADLAFHLEKSKSERSAYEIALVKAVVANGAADFIFQVSDVASDAIVDDATSTRKVKISLVDRKGNVHSWFNGDITTAITENSTLGSVTNVTSIALVNGEGIITVEKAGTWVAAETNTVTAPEQVILGVTVLAKTSVETIVANPA